MLEKLKDIETKYAEVESALGDPAQISNQQRLMELSKTHAELSPIVSAYQKYQQLESALEETQVMLESEDGCGNCWVSRRRIGDPHCAKGRINRGTEAAFDSERSER